MPEDESNVESFGVNNEEQNRHVERPAVFLLPRPIHETETDPRPPRTPNPNTAPIHHHRDDICNSHSSSIPTNENSSHQNSYYHRRRLWTEMPHYDTMDMTHFVANNDNNNNNTETMSRTNQHGFSSSSSSYQPYESTTTATVATSMTTPTVTTITSPTTTTIVYSYTNTPYDHYDDDDDDHHHNTLFLLGNTDMSLSLLDLEDGRRRNQRFHHRHHQQQQQQALLNENYHPPDIPRNIGSNQSHNNNNIYYNSTIPTTTEDFISSSTTTTAAGNGDPTTVTDSVMDTIHRLRCIFSCITLPIVPIGAVLSMTLFYVIYAALVLDLHQVCSHPLKLYTIYSTALFLYIPQHKHIKHVLFRYPIENQNTTTPPTTHNNNNVIHTPHGTGDEEYTNNNNEDEYETTWDDHDENHHFHDEGGGGDHTPNRSQQQQHPYTPYSIGMRLYDQLFYLICLIYLSMGIDLCQSCMEDLVVQPIINPTTVSSSSSSMTTISTTTTTTTSRFMDGDSTLLQNHNKTQGGISSCAVTCPHLYSATKLYVTVLQLFAFAMLLPIVFLPCIYAYVIRRVHRGVESILLQSILRRGEGSGHSTTEEDGVTVQEIMDTLQQVELVFIPDSNSMKETDRLLPSKKVQILYKSKSSQGFDVISRKRGKITDWENIKDCCICMSDLNISSDDVYQNSYETQVDTSSSSSTTTPSLLSPLLPTLEHDSVHRYQNLQQNIAGNSTSARGYIHQDIIVQTKCGHLFHQACLGGWIGGSWEDSSSNVSSTTTQVRRARRRCCPLCREDLTPPRTAHS